MRAFPLIMALLAMGGCVQPPSLASVRLAGGVLVVPADLARLYVFRNYRSGGPPIDPTVYVDGAPVGVSTMGSVFARDVPPGDHVIATDPRNPADAEVTRVRLSPGSTVYLAVDDNFVNDATVATRVVVYSIAPIPEGTARPLAERLPFQASAAREAAGNAAVFH